LNIGGALEPVFAAGGGVPRLPARPICRIKRRLATLRQFLVTCRISKDVYLGLMIENDNCTCSKLPSVTHGRLVLHLKSIQRVRDVHSFRPRQPHNLLLANVRHVVEASHSLLPSPVPVRKAPLCCGSLQARALGFRIEMWNYVGRHNFVKRLLTRTLVSQTR
jgi:hypothetical protein